MKLKTPLHILLDGADGTSKTTICQMLSRFLNLPIIKMPDSKQYIEKGSIEEFSKFFNETVIQFLEFDFILDRGYPSSLVYSRVLGRDFDLSYIDKIEKMLKPKVFIFTTLEENNSHKDDRFLRNSDEVYGIKVVNKIDKVFNLLAKEKGYNLINVNNKSPFEICNQIIEKL